MVLLEQVWVYYRSGTAECRCIGNGRHFVFTHHQAAFFCVKWRLGHRLEIVKSDWKSNSVNWCVFAWRTIPSNFIPIWFETPEFGLFWTSQSNKKRNKMSSDMTSVSDLQIVFIERLCEGIVSLIILTNHHYLIHISVAGFKTCLACYCTEKWWCDVKKSFWHILTELC